MGLLETHGSEKWEGLSEYELICDAVAIKKQNIGLLAPLLSKEESQDYAELFRSLPEGWQIARGNVSNSFQGQLFPYQKEGLKWLEFLKESNCGGLLADEMGLGKTVQVLAFISQLLLEKPCMDPEWPQKLAAKLGSFRPSRALSQAAARQPDGLSETLVKVSSR